MSNTLRNIAIIAGVGVVAYLLYPKKVAAASSGKLSASNLGKPGEVFQGVENESALDKIKAEKNALKQSAAFTGVEGNKWQDFK